MPRDVDRMKILADLLDDARVGSTPRGAPPGAVPASVRRSPLVNGPRVALPQPTPATAGLEDALRRRTAIRSFSSAPLRGSELATMAAAAHAWDHEMWAQDVDAGVSLEIFAAAWRVEGLATGLYRYEPQDGSLRWAATLPMGEAAEDLVMQREFAWAPLLLVVTGNLAAAISHRGSHGHRLLLLRAGAAAYASWLAALGMGLAGSLFAGMLPGAMRELAGADGYTRASLFAFAVGRPLPAR